MKKLNTKLYITSIFCFGIIIFLYFLQGAGRANAEQAEFFVKSPDSTVVYKVADESRSICMLTSDDHYKMHTKYRALGLKKWQDLAIVDLAEYNEVGVCGLRDHTLARTLENPKIFLIQGDSKRPINTYETFIGFGFDDEAVYYVTDDVLDIYALSEEITDSTTQEDVMEGQIIKTDESADVYYITRENNTLVKNLILDEKAFFSNFGPSWDVVITVPSEKEYAKGGIILLLLKIP